MKLRYIMFLSLLGLCICFGTVYAAMYTECGKIEDYVYEDGKSNVIVANRNAGKQVALTFDDGPSSNYTPVILDILSDNNVKGTFFVVGKNAERHREILKRIHKEGHEIGNHTYSHPDLKKLSPESVEKEIAESQRVICDIIGITPVLFRPPGGYLSNSIVDKITSNNCKTVLWSWRQDTMDWKCPNVDTVVETVLSNIRDGDIILFHDFNPGKSPTPEALKIIIPELKRRGYEFVTVSQLVNI